MFKIVDAEIGKEPEYLTVGKTPLERVHKLLSKIDSIRRSKERGSVVLEADMGLSNKFIGQVESIFKNLPKPLKWQSFLNNGLILLTDIPLNVQTASVKHSLNKAQPFAEDLEKTNKKNDQKKETLQQNNFSGSELNLL